MKKKKEIMERSNKRNQLLFNYSKKALPFIKELQKMAKDLEMKSGEKDHLELFTSFQNFYHLSNMEQIKLNLNFSTKIFFE